MSEVANKLVVLDMDRTAVNSDVAVELYSHIYDQFKVDKPGSLIKAQKDAEDKSEAFGARLYVVASGKLDTTQQEKLDSEFLKLCTDPVQHDRLVYPDVEPFLRRLGELAVPRMLLTQGDDPLWQRLKLRAARLDTLPYSILGITNADGSKLTKGAIIASWQDTSRGVYVPADVTPHHSRAILAAASVDLYDDKPSSFQSLPAACAGFCLRRDTPRPSQLGEVRDNVISVRDFRAIDPYLLYAVA